MSFLKQIGLVKLQSVVIKTPSVYPWISRDIQKRKQVIRYDETLESLDKLLELDPNYVDVNSLKFSVLNKLGKYDEALESLDKLLELDPTNAAWWNSKGIALTQKRKYDEAIGCFEKSMKLDPVNETISRNKSYAIKLREDKIKYYTHEGKQIKYYTSDGKPVNE
jgi:tetratricopeptide (TPR) repeat protein